MRMRNDVWMLVNAVLDFRSGTDLGKKEIMEMVGFAFKMAKASSDHVAARFELGATKANISSDELDVCFLRDFE